MHGADLRCAVQQGVWPLYGQQTGHQERRQHWHEQLPAGDSDSASEPVKQAEQLHNIDVLCCYKQYLLAKLSRGGYRPTWVG